MPRGQDSPSPEERDERVKLGPPPDEAIRPAAESSPQDEEDEEIAEWENEGGATEDGPQEGGSRA